MTKKTGESAVPDQLLEIRDATKTYGQAGLLRQKTEVVALQDFNLSIARRPSTITTVAGESGSGKTTLAKLILGFESLSSGQILFEGHDVSTMNHNQRREYRRNVQAVFQDPYAVFNPFYRVEHVFHLITRTFRLADDKQARRKMIEEALNVVGLHGEDVLRKYPHQLSGGQRQRIMMARAYMLKPKLIVADEPVSMVDASLRAAILDVMLRLRDEMEISFIYITHDLSTAYQIGDQIYVLYQGATAERGATTEVIDHPKHPYVQLLVESVPAPDPRQRWDTNIDLPDEEELAGFAMSGCRFYPRCPNGMEHCLTHRPPLYVTDQPEHQASCFLYDDELLADVRREETGAEGQP